MAENPTFGAWLKRRRRQLDLTQKALAFQAACSVGTIRKIEAGERRPSRQLATLLAQQLEISSEQLEPFLAFARSESSLAGVLFTSPSPQEALFPPFRRRTRTFGPGQNLPPQTTSFIGRQAELAEISRMLLREADCRLLGLVGPGGMGKTRLALAAAAEGLNEFPDGAFFVPLSAVSEVNDLIPTLAEALRFTLNSSVDPREQLLDYLGRKRLLLIVDNFEHLQEGAGLLSEILANAPQVTLLVTSRERLNLQEEWVYEVRGLAFPANDGQTTAVSSSYSAVELFTQRARQATAGFAPSAAEIDDICRICRLVEGMPLALELAAPWTKLLSCREIAAEIEQSLDFLASSLKNVEKRHRSLRVVFEQSWVRLSPDEQTVLRLLAVFRGGCTREAAEQVTGATLSILSSLVDKALLRRTNQGRYALHELIRQFAEAELQAFPDAVAQATHRHSCYFAAFLEARTPGLKGHEQKESLKAIKAEMDNVRLFWRRAVTNRDVEGIERTAECLLVYFTYSSTHYEGQLEFRRAVNALTAIPDRAADRIQLRDLIVADGKEDLLGFLLAGQAYFLARTSGRQLLSEGVIKRLLQAEPFRRRHAGLAISFLVIAMVYQGRITDSVPYGELALALSRETGEMMGEAWTLLGLGSSGIHGRPAEAEQYLRQALIVCEKSGDSLMRGYTCQNLVAAGVELGEYGEAAQYVDQAIKIFEEYNSIQGLGYGFYRAGQLAIAVGDYAGALEYFKQALACYAETRSTLHASYCQVWNGMARRLAGDFSKAEEISRETLAAFQALGDQTHAGYSLLNLGLLAFDRGDLSRAEQLQREAMAAWTEAGQEARLADASRCLGHVLVHMDESRRAQARRYFRQALELSAKHGMAPLALDACRGAAQILAQLGNTKQAVGLLALATHHKASTFETKEKARRHLAKLEDLLAPEVMQAALAQGRMQDLWTTVQDSSAALTVDES